MRIGQSTCLHRRTLLRGLGVALSLPLLDAMAPRGKAADSTMAPKPRLLCCYVPNGVNEAQWTPDANGREWKLSPTLESLQAFREELTLLTGLGHPRGKGAHEGADTWLTGADLTGSPGKDYQNAMSVDQVIAERHGVETRVPSLELSASDGTGAAGHSHTLAFDRTGTPLPAENSPARLFHRLFTADGPTARDAALRRYQERRSILDDVLSEANSLHGQLGKVDRHKLDEYLSSVRQVEQRVSRLQSWVDVPKPTVARDGLALDVMPTPHDRSRWIDVMLDLCLLAFQTDSTRVITFQWAREASGFGENGEDHHQLSHHGGNAAMLDKLAAIDRFHVHKLARVLRRLQDAEEGGASLLDHTMVMYGSGMNSGKGGGHSPKNLPLLLAGGSKLGLKHGSHLTFKVDSTPLANLLLTLLHCMGIEQESFADSTGTLSDIV